MSAFGKQLAEASWDAVRDIVETPIPHPHTYIRVVLDLVRMLRSDTSTPMKTVSWSSYERSRDSAIKQRDMRVSPTEMDRLVIGNKHYNVFADRSAGELRLTDRSDVLNDVFHTGRDLFAAPDQKGVRRELSSNHILLFPEMLDVLTLFPHSGARKSVEQARRDCFVFCRKLNEPVCDNLVEEAIDLGLLERVEHATDQLYRVGYVPVPARAAMAVESYLQTSGYQLDVSISRRAVEEQLGFIVPGVQIDRSWQEQLRPTGPVLRPEVGGSRLRLTPDDFLWVVRQRLVAPIDVGRVLVRQKEGEAAVWLLAQFEPRLKKLSEIANLDDFRSAFA
jgi:hypothetical protein